METSQARNIWICGSRAIITFFLWKHTKVLRRPQRKSESIVRGAFPPQVELSCVLVFWLNIIGRADMGKASFLFSALETRTREVRIRILTGLSTRKLTITAHVEHYVKEST